MALEIARQSVGGTGKAIRTWAIARYYVDVRDVSSIILIAEITAASTAPTALNPPLLPLSCLLTSRDIHARFSRVYFHVESRNKCIIFKLYIIFYYNNFKFELYLLQAILSENKMNQKIYIIYGMLL